MMLTVVSSIYIRGDETILLVLEERQVFENVAWQKGYEVQDALKSA